MIKNPLVTFIISVYNGSEFIENCIRSIFNQSYKNIEIVIVDDCSNDSTNKILNSLQKENLLHMKIIKNKDNLGLTKSLNIAASHAQGEWLARLDADDISRKDRIKTQIDFIKNNPEYSIIGSSCFFIDDKGKYLFSRSYPSSHSDIRNALENVSAFFPHSSVLIKKKDFLKLGGYNNAMDYSQDYELWLRASSKVKLFSIDKPLVSIRIHKMRISNHSLGDRQLIYSRACIIAYWLEKDFSVDYSIIYSKNKWPVFLNKVAFFIKNNPYYIGKKTYQVLKKSIKNKNLFNSLRFIFFNFYHLFYYIILFYLGEELFLRKKTFLFINEF